MGEISTRNKRLVRELVSILFLILTTLSAKAVTVDVIISASANPVCAGTNVTFIATPINGGDTASYQWKVNGSNVGTNSYQYIYQPINGDQVVCVLTSNIEGADNNPATSNTITMTVQARATVSVSIVASANPSCQGESVTFTATPVNGGSNPSYSWKVNNIAAGTNNPVFSYTPVDGDVVSCRLVSTSNCVDGNPAYSNLITMGITPLNPVEVSISANINPICSTDSITFTAIPTNGGASPQYQWRKDGVNINGATNVTYKYKPTNGDQINCALMSSVSCPTPSPAYSNTVTVTVIQSLVASVTVTPSTNSVCSGTSVTYTASPVNGGTTPAYKWTVNSIEQLGATNSTFIYVPSSGNIIRCVMTSSLPCSTGSPATSNDVVVTVNTIIPVSASVISNPVGSVCTGSAATYTCTPTNGGTNPLYQWRKNGVNVSGATNSTYLYTPASSSEAISCRVTSNYQCVSGNPATSNSITLNLLPSVAVSINIWASTYYCVSGDNVTFSAGITNGGTAPQYQWYKNNTLVNGATNSTYTYAPASNDKIHCLGTSSLSTCLYPNPATSNTITMIVYTTGTACSGTPTVSHGGTTYNTVQIGTQCWLRENIRIGTTITTSSNQTNNSVIERYCYRNDTNYCNVYGGLYQWAEAVQYLNGVTNTTHWANPQPTNVQGICPSGWHIPTNTEAQTLITTLGGSTLAGGAMKETGTVHFGHYAVPYNIGATNSSGFTALPSGACAYGGYFINAGRINEGNCTDNGMYGSWWTTTKGNQAVAAYFFGVMFATADNTQGQTEKAIGYAIRCIKN